MTLNIPSTAPHTPFLDAIDSPKDVKALAPDALKQLALEVRQAMLFSVSKTGGHLGAGLGVVELTIALHYVLNTPEDTVIWDVGHQAYPHKMLTGRRNRMLSMRHKDGLAPFPARYESPYDAFGTGHSSTSISAALGVALAHRQQGSNLHSVAVIGDGAMTAGMAFEALTHAAHTQANILIVLNDNEMSISENVGGLATHLAQSAPSFIQPLADTADTANLFTALGVHYVGPIDGHDLNCLITELTAIIHLQGPKLLHIRTSKGKGLKEAEDDPIGYHAIAKTPSAETAVLPKVATFANVFGHWACNAAARHPNLVAITPAMREGSDLVAFSKQYPDRYFDVAIAEQHAVTLAAGMATAGLKPVVAIYSTFLQRGYDQLIHDVAIQNLPVIFAVDRAGLVGEDGPTHHGCFDISYLRCIPNMAILAPSSAQELTAMLDLALTAKSPVAIRYPRGAALDTPLTRPINWGKSAQLQQGNSGIAIISVGPLLDEASLAAKTLDASLIDLRFIKPLDKSLIEQLANTHTTLICIEDHAVMGGAGAAIGEYLHRIGYKGHFVSLGIKDVWVEHASRSELLADEGLNASGIIQAIHQHIK